MRISSLYNYQKNQDHKSLPQCQLTAYCVEMSKFVLLFTKHCNTQIKYKLLFAYSSKVIKFFCAIKTRLIIKTDNNT